jgi:hypothetical protein
MRHLADQGGGAASDRNDSGIRGQRRTPELAVAVNALGLVRQSQTRHAEALTCRRALTIFER